MNNTIKRAWNSNRLVSVEDLSGMTFQGEYGGHTFEVSGVDDSGSAVQLSGTVTAVFLRADNAAISISGSISSGKAVVTLTSDCYTVPGRFLFTIYTTANSQKTAIYSATGNVVRTDGVATGSVPPLVTDSIQTGSITVSGNSTLGGNVTIDGVLDVTKRRCYATLSSAGWYRVMVYNAPDSGATTGGSGLVVDFNIQRAARAENHSVTLRCASTGLISFVNEQSKSYLMYIDKIRYVYDSTNLKAYVDIHYTGSDLASTQIGVEYTVHASSLNMQEQIVSGNLSSAATSPVSPETVLTEYTFAADGNNSFKTIGISKTTTSGAFLVTEASVTANTRMVATPQYYSGAPVPWFVMLQPSSGFFNVYVRDANGNTPADGTQIDLDILIDNR